MIMIMIMIMDVLPQYAACAYLAMERYDLQAKK